VHRAVLTAMRSNIAPTCRCAVSVSERTT